MKRKIQKIIFTKFYGNATHFIQDIVQDYIRRNYYINHTFANILGTKVTEYTCNFGTL